MRIGIVLSNTPSYSETFFNSKIKGLQKNGMEVRLYCQTKKDDFTLCPVIESPKVSRSPFLQAWYFVKEFVLLLPYLLVVLRYIKLERKEGTGIVQLFKKIYLNAHLLKAKLDWLHFGFATQALGSETVAKAIGAKMAVSFRGFDINVYPIKHHDCYKALWKHVDKVHSISQYLLSKAVSMGLPVETPSAIITPAVQLDELPLSNHLAASENIKIVTIARLTWIKGLDIAIAAMAKLKENGFTFKYYIIGGGDKNYTERYKFMAYELGLNEEVVFCGKLSHHETLEHVSTADLYVQPSLNEGFCNAILEAQAMGKLTIASNVGGLPENIVDGKTGWLFENYSSEALAQQIETVLALSEADKKTICQNAQKRVIEEFNIEKQQAEFVSFYKI
ncbi:glycosyltransferase family 4 protein [Aequorivita antarctica]|uniref:Glycosyltransferase family 4 protein n=1 Tax=Aequorivita antarctica TaxID=153266 RepID=A0A5C6YYH1_9FLAO|nr:glycosyltransferase family 4 protein [Aequorivita antarctica]TXD72483.1 glycosyltransferase family 4 protein [Aequorivita antarctica]SRX75617.1 D-inositol 3-phosphate glycosyltransferase [Aequorivita antarctica]